jgi:hypothetical protein
MLTRIGFLAYDCLLSDITINKEKFSGMIDTGNAYFSIPKQLIDSKLPFKLGDYVVATDGSFLELKTYDPINLKVGDYSAGKFTYVSPVAEHKIKQSAIIEIKGCKNQIDLYNVMDTGIIIPGRVFSNTSLLIDGYKRLVYVTDSVNSFNIIKSQPLKTIGNANYGLVYTEIKVNNVDFNAMIDTGCMGDLIIMNESGYKKIKSNSKLSKTKNYNIHGYFDVLSTNNLIVDVLGFRVKMNASILKTTSNVISDCDIILGSGIFRNRRIVIDYKGSRLLLLR